MKVTRRQLRRIIKEALGAPTFQQWAADNNLQIDVDPITGEKVVLISDEFAMRQGLPDGVDWNVEQSYDEDGWIVSPFGQVEPDFEEIAYGGLDDMDDIGIQVRGY
jgi:hypothetical protein